MSVNNFMKLLKLYSLGKKPPNEYMEPDFEKDASTIHIQGTKNIKDIKTKYPQTNLSTRNFPLTTAELQKKLKTKDGGDLYLFATTLSNDNKVLIICKRATNA